MPTANNELIALENKFWQSMVDEDTDTALALLDEPALMVSAHGSMKFDHAGYRKMAEQGSMVVKSFKLSDVEVMFPTEDTAVLTYKVEQAISKRGESHEVRQDMTDSSVWTRKDGQWRCAMHTEAPVANGKS
ncbi:MAG: nuclear transport factor 2 family protein [Polaromonas sp.]|uniref:nuclear transport factor 2 family protein n=1 Tax=Polaromonas sp. TaxID=1869339 RepID=UPI00326537F1